MASARRRDNGAAKSETSSRPWTPRSLLGRRLVALSVGAALLAGTPAVWAAPPKNGAAAAPKAKAKPAPKKPKKKGGKGAKGKHPDESSEGEAVDGDSPAAVASKRKAEGDQAMQEKRYADALLAYDTAYAIEPTPALLYNRARAEELSEHYPEALGLLEEFQAKAPKDLLAKVPQLDELIASVRAHVASLTVKVNVDGALVKLRGVTLGSTPLPVALRVPAGKATLEASLDGYSSAVSEVVLKPLEPGAAPNTVELAIARLVKPTTLLIESSVADAAASIDGSGVGTPPVRSVVEPGPHTVEVSKSGYTTARRDVTLAEGDTREVRLSPTKEPAITSKWWFWTGLGVAVAGGAALTAALLTEKDAGRGSIAPGQVSAGLHF
jgi:hypothetical protein